MRKNDALPNSSPPRQRQPGETVLVLVVIVWALLVGLIVYRVFG